jgi:Asp-tRNA(Asn)/Glu-tRNA(Gln) amidotransferase A subunit family amidase
MDILGLPFTEQTVFAIGAAYEAATRHRAQPPGFGPLDR